MLYTLFMSLFLLLALSFSFVSPIADKVSANRWLMNVCKYPKVETTKPGCSINGDGFLMDTMTSTEYHSCRIVWSLVSVLNGSS